jgi:hypothetical protein
MASLRIPYYREYNYTMITPPTSEEEASEKEAEMHRQDAILDKIDNVSHSETNDFHDDHSVGQTLSPNTEPRTRMHEAQHCPSNATSSSKYECRECGPKSSFDSYEMYKNHLRNHRIGIWQCTGCLSTFTNYYCVLRHIKWLEEGKLRKKHPADSTIIVITLPPKPRYKHHYQSIGRFLSTRHHEPLESTSKTPANHSDSEEETKHIISHTNRKIPTAHVMFFSK